MKNVVKEVRKKKRKDKLNDIKSSLFVSLLDSRFACKIMEMRVDSYRKKAWKCFSKMLTLDSLAIITHLNEAIDKIVSAIHEQSGWWMSYNSEFTYEDNYQNMHDYEFRSWDTYRIHRNENGYYVDTTEPYNHYLEYIRRKEIEFFEKYKGLLESLHSLLVEREKFYNGNYRLKDETDRELANKLLMQLGYIKETKTIIK